jgi:hypothetical protein
MTVFIYVKQVKHFFIQSATKLNLIIILMTIELDHLFICSQVNALEHLLDLGLIEGRSNTHPGQGTANKCIFWQNFMLELLFIVDEREVSSPIIAPTHLQERCNYQQTAYSPFGVAFRRQAPDLVLPFKTWAYKPPYLSELQIDIVADTNPSEPLLFVVPFKKNHTQPINHPAGMRQVTEIQITIPANTDLSKASQAIDHQGLLKFSPGRDHLVTIEFDRNLQRRQQDFHPHLPLKFRW